MAHNRLRDRIEDGEVSLGTRVMSPWPGVVEVAGQAGVFDYVEFLGEYAPWDLHDLENFARTAELAGLSSMMKVDAANREFVAQRAMAAGVQNVLFAGVRSVADAREAVAAVRPEPAGRAGVRADRRNGYVGGYASPEEVVAWCEDVVVAVMIEKAAAVETLDEILAVEGVDMVQFGGGDYAVSIGQPGGGEAVDEAEVRTIETALDHGVAVRAEINHPEEADRYLELGVRDFNLNVDLNVLDRFWTEEGAALADQVADVER